MSDRYIPLYAIEDLLMGNIMAINSFAFFCVLFSAVNLVSYPATTDEQPQEGGSHHSGHQDFYITNFSDPQVKAVIHDYYAMLHDDIIDGKFIPIQLVKSLSSVLKQVMEIIDRDGIISEDKKIAVSGLMKYIEKLIEDHSLFTATTDEAKNFRKWFFFNLQKALELSPNIIETKYLVWKALARS